MKKIAYENFFFYAVVLPKKDRSVRLGTITERLRDMDRG